MDRPARDGSKFPTIKIFSKALCITHQLLSFTARFKSRTVTEIFHGSQIKITDRRLAFKGP